MKNVKFKIIKIRIIISMYDIFTTGKTQNETHKTFDWTACGSGPRVGHSWSKRIFLETNYFLAFISMAIYRVHFCSKCIAL